MERKKLKWQIPFLILLLIGTILILRKQIPYQTNNGTVFGTFYKATYQYDKDLQPEIEAELKKVNISLSPFDKNSIITRINNNEEVIPDSFFLTVFRRAKQISEETNGAFDITVAPLVNAWGFGFKKKAQIDSALIDSLKQIVGYKKIAIDNGRIVKADSRILLDCSSIAKGYGSDVVARLFDRKGIQNYMIEIGGEITAKGVNPQKTPWRIGINKPIEDSLAINQEIETILQISNVSMATSGNYRNFYYQDGKKYAHTIDPRTGYPVEHSLLSATVIAADCMSADAYATSFMVMGLKEAEAFVELHPEIDAYFIYTDKNGKMQTYHTQGMKKYMIEK